MLVKPLFKETTPEDEDYKLFIRQQPCLARNRECFGEVVPHHEQEKGHGAKGKKCSDFRTLPLCMGHHDQRHRIGRSFYAKHGIDYESEIVRLNKKWGEVK